MFNNKKTILSVPPIEYITKSSFLDQIDKLCDSFVKIYKCKRFNDDVKIDGIEEASYNYLDLIFEKCVNFIIETEKKYQDQEGIKYKINIDDLNIKKEI